MADEVKFIATTGTTGYFTVHNPAGQFRRVTGGAFEDYDSGNWADYAHTATELGAGLFSGDQPGDLPDANAVAYLWIAREQVGGTPAPTDPIRGLGQMADSAENRIRNWLNQPVSTNNATITGTGTIVAAIQAKTDNLPAAPAAVGSPMTLADGAIAKAKFAADLDGSNTLPEAMEIVAAMVAGKISGAGTGTEIFVGMDGVTVRATVTVDSQGNRSAVTY